MAWLAGCGAPKAIERVEPARPAGELVAAPQPASQAGQAPSGVGEEAARRARALLGAPYRHGGADPGGLDCSGLIYYVYGQVGVTLPRTTEAQQQAVQAVPLDALRPGDLVFFRLPTPHVGLYVGAGEFVHAPGSGRAVETATLAEPWFLLAFAGAGRVSP